MAELGSLGMVVRAAVGKAAGDADAWVDAYASKDGWFRLDQAQRRLEAWVANLDDEPEERPLGVVRGVYEDACRAMADGFTRALVADKWTISTSLHQTRIYSEIVTKGSYLIVEDTNVNGHPVSPLHGAGPMEAVQRFLQDTDMFVADREREKFFITFNPKGYLKKVR